MEVFKEQMAIAQYALRLGYLFDDEDIIFVRQDGDVKTYEARNMVCFKRFYINQKTLEVST